MSKALLAFLAVAAVSIAMWGATGDWIGAAAQEGTVDPVEDAYKKAMEERRTYDEIPDRLAVTQRFLKQYPETKYTARLITHVFYYQGEKMGDMPGAIAYAEELRAKIVDPEIAKDIDREMVGLYGDAGMTDKMIALATKLEEDGEMKFNDFWKIVEVGTENSDWEMVREYCSKARPMANGEAFKSDWPQYEFSDEEVERAGEKRQGMLKCKDAWARANMGQLDAALADFAAAEKLIGRSYIGVPEYDFNQHWGNVLLMKGDYESAIEKFAPEALIMADEDALAGLKKAYGARNGGESGFEEYAARLHRSIARTVDDFTLPDYQGNSHQFGGLRGDVTLLAFWFPT